MAYTNKPDFELHKGLTAEDFQQKLYHWLEEQGILPGLRTYLRHQLISALRHTHLSSEYLNRKRGHLSPKIHALNLLVAEYLLNENYHYTVSVFHSEEPYLGHLPARINLPSEVASMKYFKENDIGDVLESLNLGLNSSFRKKIVDIYFDEKEDLQGTSLLKAIFQAYVGGNEPQGMTKQELSTGNSINTKDKEIISNKQRSDMTSKASTNKTDLMYNLLQGNNFQHEKSLVKQEDGFRNSEWKQHDFEKRVQDELKKLHKFQKETTLHRKKFEEDIMVKQQKLQELMNLFQNQQVQLKLHYEQIQKKEATLKDNETKFENIQMQERTQLTEKQNEIIRAQQILEEDFKRLNQEQNTVKFLHKEVEVGRNHILEVAKLLGDSQQELKLLQSLHIERLTKSEGKEIHQAEQLGKLNISGDDVLNLEQTVGSLQEHAIRACQRTISQLKDENTKLQMIANEQRSKINALISKTSILNSQLEEATAALRLLSAQNDLQQVNSSQQQHIPFPITHLEDKTQLIIEGHDQNELFPRAKTPKNKQSQKRAQNQYQKDCISNNQRQEGDESMSSTASSPTEEILREARRRLEQLEIESDEVDRRYYKFKQKHLSERSEISAKCLSHTIPITLQPLERDKSLHSYDVAMATCTQKCESSLPPPYPLQKNNFSEQFGSRCGLRMSLHREEPEPFINQLIFNTQFSNRKSSHCSTVHSRANLPSSSDKFQQIPIISREKTVNYVGITVGNNKTNPRVLILPENSNQVDALEVDQNSSEFHGDYQSVAQILFENKHFEPSLVHNNSNIKELSLQNFSRDQIQHNIQREISPDTDGKHLYTAEKNDLSAFKLDTRCNNHGTPPEGENIDNTKIEMIKDYVTDVQPAACLINDKENDKNTNKLPSELAANEKDFHEEADALEAQVSNSSLPGSSPKLSIGTNDSKVGEDSDFW